MTNKELKDRALNLKELYRTVNLYNCNISSDLFDKPIRIEAHVNGEGRGIEIIELDDNYYGIVMDKGLSKVLESTYSVHDIFLLKKRDDKDEYKIKINNVYNPATSKKEKAHIEFSYDIQGFYMLYQDTYVENIGSDFDFDFLEPSIKLFRRYFAEINK